MNTSKIGQAIKGLTYKESQKLLPEIQKKYDRKVKFIITQTGNICLVHDW